MKSGALSQSIESRKGRRVHDVSFGSSRRFCLTLASEVYCRCRESRSVESHEKRDQTVRIKQKHLLLLSPKRRKTWGPFWDPAHPMSIVPTLAPSRLLALLASLIDMLP